MLFYGEKEHEMTDAAFDRALDFVLRWEGRGFTSDPNDPGGPTKAGISLRFIRNDNLEPEDIDQDGDGLITWRDVAALPAEKIRSIYRKSFWDRLHLDRLPGRIALVMFDSAVNVGRSRATRWIQETLGDVDVDGVLGSQTLASLADFLACSRSGCRSAETALSMAVIYRRRAYCLLLARPIQGNHQHWAERYLDGWLNRLRDLEREVRAP